MLGRCWTIIRGSAYVGASIHIFTLITAGKDVPVERTRDEEDRMYIIYSACSYAVSPVQFSAIEEADPH